MQCFQSESDGLYASVSDGLEENGGKFVPLMPISVWKQTLWWRNCSGSKWSLKWRQCYTSLMSGYSTFIWCNILTGNVWVLIHVWAERERDYRAKQILNHSFFWITPKCHIWLTRRKNLTIPATLLQPNPLYSASFFSQRVNIVWVFLFSFFFCPFIFHQRTNFPLKYPELYRVKADGSCPFCSGGQVWADNCWVCAAETDDYRLYCLSQAQSTLIQQSHLYLIYESLSLSLSLSSSHPSIPYFFLIHFKLLLSPFFPSVYLSAGCDCSSRRAFRS